MKVADCLLRAASGDLSPLSQAGSKTWAELVELACFEGMEGLLYRRCASAGIDIPAAHEAPLRASYRRVAANNCVTLSRLALLVGAMGDRGLDVLVLPGASLLPLYPDPGCRPMDDVDLLVRDDQLDAAGSLFRDQGFDQSRRHEGLYTRDGLTIDVHTDLVNGNRIRARYGSVSMDMDEVWQRAEVQQGTDVEARTLSAADALLYTALHALRHSFRRLTWFIDLHLLIQVQEDWDSVKAKALQCNAIKPLIHCFHYLENHMPAAVSSGFPATTDLPTLSSAETFLLRRLSATRPDSELGEILWAFSCQGFAARAQFLLEFLFPRPHVLMQVFPSLPRAMIPLAYGLRAGQLLLRGTKQLGVLARSG